MPYISPLGQTVLECTQCWKTRGEMGEPLSRDIFNKRRATNPPRIITESMHTVITDECEDDFLYMVPKRLLPGEAQYILQAWHLTGIEYCQ